MMILNVDFISSSFIALIKPIPHLPQQQLNDTFFDLFDVHFSLMKISRKTADCRDIIQFLILLSLRSLRL